MDCLLLLQNWCIQFSIYNFTFLQSSPKHTQNFYSKKKKRCKSDLDIFMEVIETYYGLHVSCCVSLQGNFVTVCSVKWQLPLWSRSMLIQLENPGSRTRIKFESPTPCFGCAAIWRVHQPHWPGVTIRGETDILSPEMVREESQIFKISLSHLPPFCHDHYSESSQGEMISFCA